MITILYCFRQLPCISNVMGAVPSLMGNVYVYACGGQSEEAR